MDIDWALNGQEDVAVTILSKNNDTGASAYLVTRLELHDPCIHPDVTPDHPERVAFVLMFTDTLDILVNGELVLRSEVDLDLLTELADAVALAPYHGPGTTVTTRIVN